MQLRDMTAADLEAVLASLPAAYWRLDDLEGPLARNAASGQGQGRFEAQIAYYMPGSQAPAFPGLGGTERRHRPSLAGPARPRSTRASRGSGVNAGSDAGR